MAEALDPPLRIKDVLTATALSHSVFYVLRSRGEFPPPDGFLNGGSTPVWRTSTVRAFNDATLAESLRARAAKRRQPPTQPAA